MPFLMLFLVSSSARAKDERLPSQPASSDAISHLRWPPCRHSSFGWPIVMGRLALLGKYQPSFQQIIAREEWFERLSPSARQVISVADGMRQAIEKPWPKIFLEYLVVALAEEAGGPLPEMMRRKGIPLEELMTQIRERSRTNIPSSGSYCCRARLLMDG